MAGQVVNITINVTDGNTSEAVEQIVAQLHSIGPAGETAGAQAGAGLDQIGEHALSARENVRLLNDDLGLRIPRAMQAAIMQSQMLTGAISMIGPGLIAMGAVDILMGVGEKIGAAYEKWVLLKGVIEASDSVVKGFGDAAAQAFKHAEAEYESYLRITQGPQAADQRNLDEYMKTAVPVPKYQDKDFMGLPDEVKGKFEAITGESIMPKDLDATIAKMKDYNEQLQKALDTTLAAKSPGVLGGPYSLPQLQEITKEKESIKIGESLINDLMGMQKDYTQHVSASQAEIAKDVQTKADEAVAKETEKQNEILSLQRSAMNSQLTGIDLLEAQRVQALDSFQSKYGTSRAAIDAINQEYNNKEMALWNQQWEEADKAMRTAQQAADQAAHIGAGSINDNLQNTISDINSKHYDAPGAADELRKAAKMKYDAEILAEQNQFDAEMDQMGMKSADAQISSYAKIADSASHAAKKVQDDWQKAADKVGHDWDAQKGIQSSALLEMSDVDAKMLREMEQLHTKTMEQIAKEEEMTARQSLPEWQQTQLKIVDAFQDRVREIEAAEAQQEAALQADMQKDHARMVMDKQAEAMLNQDTNAKILASRLLMNAQIEQSDEETRDKLATGLQSFFKNPEQFLEKRVMDTAFQMMANDMLSTFKSNNPAGSALQWLFGMGPQMSTSTDPGTDFASIFGGHSSNPLSLSSGTSTLAMQTFQQGSTQLITGSSALLSAATAVQSLGGMNGSGGMVGMAGMGSMSNGGFGTLGSTGSVIGGSSQSNPGIDASGSADISGNFADLSSLSPAGSGWSSSLDGLPGLLASQQMAANGTGLAGAKVMTASGGLLMGGIGIMNAYQNSDPTSGVISGAMGGAEVGSVFGPIGTAVGAVVGGVAGGLAGYFGDHGVGNARQLDVNTIQPALLTDFQAYEAGSSSYSSLASNLNNMLTSAQNSTNQMGSGARRYFSSHIEPELAAALSSLQKQEIGGRNQVTMSAAQYHTGGWVNDFGDLGTSDTEGYIHALQNEFMVTPSAAAAHAPILQAMNSGVNFGYASTVQPRMATGSGSGSSINLTIQALDSKSVATWAKGGGGRILVAAINQANRQYSGVGRG